MINLSTTVRTAVDNQMWWEIHVVRSCWRTLAFTSKMAAERRTPLTGADMALHVTLRMNSLSMCNLTCTKFIDAYSQYHENALDRDCTIDRHRLVCMDAHRCVHMLPVYKHPWV